MCFSTEASFTAAALLAGFGAATIAKVKKPSLYLLAIIPCLFALQQFSEGLIWYNFRYQPLPSWLLTGSIYTYLFFAFLVWPVWIPLAFWIPQGKGLRRILLFAIFLCGIALSVLNALAGLQGHVGAEVSIRSIQYTGSAPEQLLLYPLVVLAPCFISDLKNAAQFGFLIVTAYLIADYIYENNLTSVWCFFSAIASLFVYKIIKDNQSDASLL